MALKKDFIPFVLFNPSVLRGGQMVQKGCGKDGSPRVDLSLSAGVQIVISLGGDGQMV